jgi:hypothetical protein
MKRQAPHETQQPQLQPPQPAQAAHALQPPTLQPRQPLQPPQPLPQALHPLQPLQPRWAYCWPGTLTSLSKTKNVPKLTSNISSSLRVNCGGVSRNCTSGVGPTAPVAGAPPVIAMDMPTTPATGTAFFRCFCFVCGIAKPPRLLVNATKACAHSTIYRRPRTDTLQDRRLARRPSIPIAGAPGRVRGRHRQGGSQTRFCAISSAMS